MQLRLSDEGADLRSLERNRCPLRIMLVIGIAATRGRHHCVVVLDEVPQPSACLRTLGLKSTTRSIHVPNPHTSHKPARPYLPLTVRGPAHLRTGALTIPYGLRVTREQPPTALRAVPTLWYTVAFNLTALLVAVLGIGFDDEAVWPLWLPVASLASCAVIGVVCLFGEQTRSFGAGCLGGTAVATLVYLVLFMIFFVTYFIVPGGHELS